MCPPCPSEEIYEELLLSKTPNSGFSGSGEHFELLVKKMLLRNRLVFVFVCVLVSFYRVTGNGHHNIKFRFVDLEHAELYLESPICDISRHLSGNNGCNILL